MKLYSESFKKSVVKKVLSEGVILVQVAKKLKISASTLHRWVKQYKDKVTPDSPDLDALVEECRETIDIDSLLDELEHVQKSADSESLLDVERILNQGKKTEQYSLHEKIIIVETFNKLPENEKGIWLRTHGLYSQYITLWEQEVFTMAKQKVNESEELRKLRDENKRLKKQLNESLRNEKELKILIELKKKYQNLFVDSKDN